MRYIVVVLVVALLGIVGVLTLSNRGNSKNTSKASTVKSTKIADVSDKSTTTLSWTEQGRLVGEDQRKSVRIVVTPTSRTIQLLSEYEDRVERSENFTNTQPAFDTLVAALDQLNFGKERTAKQPDERAMCPFGLRYIYTLNVAASDTVRTWSDSCTSADGTFGGSSSNAQDIRRLFQAQIADYNKFISGTGL